MDKRVKLTGLLTVTAFVLSMVGTVLADEVVPFSETSVVSYVDPICTEPVTIEGEFNLAGTNHFAADGSLTTHLRVTGNFVGSTADGEAFRDHVRTNLTFKFDPDGNLVEAPSRGVRYHWSMPTAGLLLQQAGRVDDLNLEILTGITYIDPQLEAGFRAYTGYTGDIFDMLFIDPQFINYGYCWVLGVAP